MGVTSFVVIASACVLGLSWFAKCHAFKQAHGENLLIVAMPKVREMFIGVTLLSFVPLLFIHAPRPNDDSGVIVFLLPVVFGLIGCFAVLIGIENEMKVARATRDIQEGFLNPADRYVSASKPHAQAAEPPAPSDGLGYSPDRFGKAERPAYELDTSHLMMVAKADHSPTPKAARPLQPPRDKIFED